MRFLRTTKFQHVYRCFFLASLFLAINIYVKAQQPKVDEFVVIKGEVTSSKDGKPLLGVTVQNAKDPKNVTVTDNSGKFQIKVPQGTKTLRFSYVGYVSTDVSLLGKTTIKVSLVEGNSDLDEVVVVGYGTQKKLTKLVQHKL